MYAYVKVFGERNSGTIYLTGLIRENTDAIVMEGDTRGKAGSLSMRHEVFRSKYTGDNDYLQDLDHFRILHSDFGWKHAAPPVDVMQFSAHGGLTKFVFTVKHPCFWLLSMFNRPYNPRLKRAATFQEFIRAPWPVSRRDNIGDPGVLPTPVDLFERKIGSYMDALERFPENSVFIRYEDILEDPETSVERICQGILGAGRKPFTNLTRSTKTADENYESYKGKYLSKDYLKQISREDLDFINSRLSQRVLSFCDYSILA